MPLLGLFVLFTLVSSPLASANPDACAGAFGAPTPTPWIDLPGYNKMVWMDKYSYESGVTPFREVPGATVYGKQDLTALTHILGAPEYYRRAIRYLTSNTEDPIYTSRAGGPAAKENEDHVTLFVDQEGKILGAYVYLIYYFIDNEYSSLSRYWVNGYFDESGEFLGRAGIGDDLEWSTY